MKLLRYGPPGQEKPGLLDAEGRLRDLSGVSGDGVGEALLPGSLARLAALDPSDLPAVSGTPRLGPCVAGVGKFPAVGLNYADHAKETGGQAPREPIIFTKMTSCICGPNDDTVIPRGSVKTDWEVELGVVIGTPGKYITEADALAHVAGYCAVDDVSEREYQLERKGQWVKGKSADSFGPIGPWLVTPDEVPDPQTLDIWLEVDGARRQDGEQDPYPPEPPDRAFPAGAQDLRPLGHVHKVSGRHNIDNAVDKIIHLQLEHVCRHLAGIQLGARVDQHLQILAYWRHFQIFHSLCHQIGSKSGHARQDTHHIGYA